jgi:hypothetical protein
MSHLTYAKELEQLAKQYKEYAFEYKKERALYSEALNKITSLLYTSGLKDDKASFENKLVKLLATPYAEEAQHFIEQLNTSRGNYKGWEAVLESYKAHISALQSVIKFNLIGEVNTNIIDKYKGGL